MKKYLFLLLLFFSCSSLADFNTMNPTCSQYSPALKGSMAPDGHFNYNGGTCAGHPDIAYTVSVPASGGAWTEYYCNAAGNSDNCNCPEGTVYGTDSASPPVTGCVLPPDPVCPAGQRLNSVMNSAGIPVKNCVSDSPDNSGSSSSSSSEKACPSGQHYDDNHSCTVCSSGTVLNISSGSCESKNSCTYPQTYSAYDNGCHANSNNCAINTGYNPLTEEKCATSPVLPPPTCPSGWTLMPDNTCIPSAASSEASGSASGAASSTPSNNTSAPSNSQSSTPNPKPPTSPGDNTDQNQPTNNSQSIPSGTSNSTCLANASAASCKAVEDCKLTFGADRCVGVTENITCPNSYVINGQKICVLPAGTNGSGSSAGSGSGTSTGSNSSKQAGECDPESKGYLSCLEISGIKIPTEKGSFDESKATQAVHDAEEELKNKINSVKSEMTTVLAVHFTGAGTMEDECKTIRGVEVCFGMAKFKPLLVVVGSGVIFFAYCAALIIVLRK